MIQQGQAFKLTAKGADGEPMWAYRYRLQRRSSAWPQEGRLETRSQRLTAAASSWARVRVSANVPAAA
jgi:hypothetical protein